MSGAATDETGQGGAPLALVQAAEARAAAALDRLVLAFGRMGAAAPGGSADEVAALTEALEAERAANEQLEERVRAIKERQEKVVARLEAEVASLRAAIAERDAAFEGLRVANDRLRTNNMALREAILAGVPDADLVNRAMAHELDGLRAARAADRAEVDLLLAELRPHAEDPAHA